jgi:hypothetical protein
MAFQVSPGINVSEIDLTSSIPAISVSTGAIAGNFNWGPVEKITVISTESELASVFGKPDSTTADSFFTAASFLAYSNDLRVVRASTTGQYNSIAPITGTVAEETVAYSYNAIAPISSTINVSIANSAVYLADNYGESVDSSVKFASRFLGDIGNTLKISVCSDSTTFADWEYSEEFTAAPAGANNSQLHIIVVDEDGLLTGTPGTVLEKYEALSKDSDSADYYVTTLYSDSAYVYAIGHIGANWGTASGSLVGDYDSEEIFTESFAGGDTGNLYLGATALIKNDSAYVDDAYGASVDSNVAFVARYAGSIGDTLKISVCSDTDSFASWDYADYFDSAPSTSSFAASVGGSDDEMHIIVIDEDGVITNVPGTVLERYAFVSKASDAKNEDGSSNYYREVIYTRSRYVYLANHLGANWGTSAVSKAFDNENNYTKSFGGGQNGTGASLATAYSMFGNTEEVDISFLICGSANSSIVTGVVSIADSRKDCVAFFSPALADCLGSTAAADIVDYANGFATRSSYAVMDSGWKYAYDKYNDVYRWVPLNGDVAGLCARTDVERDPWWSPAGLQRGSLRNVVKLAFNPNKTERDLLYKAGVNPVVSFPGEGTILYGDKTFQNRPSAFDRINVRRLFIVLEKAIARASRATLFEFNDEFTRAQFVSLVEPFLRTVQGRRGIYDYRVVCDESNNTPDIIDRNEFVGDIYIKPARSINYIQLNFVAVRTGVSFEEITGRF